MTTGYKVIDETRVYQLKKWDSAASFWLPCSTFFSLGTTTWRAPFSNRRKKLQSLVLMCCPVHLHGSTFYCARTNSAVMPEITGWENYSAGGGERGLKHGWRSATLLLITASLAAVLSHVDNSSRTADKNTCRGYSWKNSAAFYVFIGSLYI